MPALSSTVPGKDWTDQPSSHAPTHPTVMAAMVIVDPDGTEVYRYQGRDFPDRTNDDDLWEADAWRDHFEV